MCHMTTLCHMTSSARMASLLVATAVITGCARVVTPGEGLRVAFPLTLHCTCISSSPQRCHDFRPSPASYIFWLSVCVERGNHKTPGVPGLTGPRAQDAAFAGTLETVLLSETLIVVAHHRVLMEEVHWVEEARLSQKKSRRRRQDCSCACSRAMNNSRSTPPPPPTLGLPSNTIEAAARGSSHLKLQISAAHLRP